MVTRTWVRTWDPDQEKSLRPGSDPQKFQWLDSLQTNQYQDFDPYNLNGDAHSQFYRTRCLPSKLFPKPFKQEFLYGHTLSFLKTKNIPNK
jgi:hypothetical protein